jgi:hypothetical protein
VNVEVSRPAPPARPKAGAGARAIINPGAALVPPARPFEIRGALSYLVNLNL